MNAAWPLEEAEAYLEQQLRTLLQEKHLYQRLRISVEPLKEVIRQNAPPGKLAGLIPGNFVGSQNTTVYTTDRVLNQLERILADPWEFPSRTIPFAGRGASGELSLQVRLPGAKLYCATCKRVEAFNPVEMWESSRAAARRSPTVQQWALTYHCQSCEGHPEVLLVRREGLTLSVCGRSPMEAVEVPQVIPPAAREYYGGAILAHQSGQHLAAVFMFRTLIEQWIRSLDATVPTQADEALEWYMATLPEDFKGRFPSMRELYGELSADIHQAAGSAELVEKARERLLEHFSARTLFKM